MCCRKTVTFRGLRNCEIKTNFNIHGISTAANTAHFLHITICEISETVIDRLNPREGTHKGYTPHEEYTNG